MKLCAGFAIRFESADSFQLCREFIASLNVALCKALCLCNFYCSISTNLTIIPPPEVWCRSWWCCPTVVKYVNRHCRAHLFLACNKSKTNNGRKGNNAIPYEVYELNKNNNGLIKFCWRYTFDFGNMQLQLSLTTIYGINIECIVCNVWLEVNI